MTEEWRNANHGMPDVMRLVYTDPDANKFHPVLKRENPNHRWPDDAVVAVIGPFDGHMGQPELQDRLLEVIRQWNAEAASRAANDKS